MFRNRVDFRGRLTLFGFLILLSLGIMLADQLEFMRPVERVTSVVLAPLQTGARQLGLNLGSLGVFFTNLDQLRAENKRLQATLDAAQVDRGILAEQANQLDQLEKELNFRRNPQNRRFETVSADVLNYDPSGQNQAIVVNKGDNDKVRPGMTVVDSSGYLVGRVNRVTSDKATISLITDKMMGVNVSNQRYDKSTKVTVNEPGDGTASGQGLNLTKLLMQRIKPTADIKAEDWVFTNGLGGNYPPNILVGYVEKVISQEGQPDKQAEIRPSADLERLRRVQIITNARET